MKLKTSILLFVSMVVAGIAILLITTQVTSHAVQINGPKYKKIVDDKDLVADILPPPAYTVEAYLLALQMRGVDGARRSELRQRFAETRQEFEKRHEVWQKSTSFNQALKAEMAQARDAGNAFYDQAESLYFPALQTANTIAIAEALNQVNKAYEAHRQHIDQAVAMAVAESTKDEKAAAATIRWVDGLSYGVGLVMLVGSLLGGILLFRSVFNRIGGEPAEAMRVASNVAEGKLDNQIDLMPGDNSSLLANMDKMQKQLSDRLAAEHKLAEENLRVRAALDSVTTGVMIADNARTIIYANKAVVDLLSHAEVDIRKQLPSFSATKLVGQNIDSFHKNPSHQAKLLSQFTSTYSATLNIGGRTLVVRANPVLDVRGERVGSVAEWADRTAELVVENEMSALIEAANAGDFSRRLEEKGKDGFFLQLAQGINRLVATSERGMHDVAQVLKALADGDLSKRVEGEYQGLFGQLKDDANATSERLSEIVSQIREATDAINTAAREIASGNADLSSRTESQASSLEETASSMDELTSTVKQNADNARQANQLAKGASDVAVKGGSVVSAVVQTMGAIAESSKKIADIISVIDGIAFQTNILALNAAVEAARAGEQGRGFAVVAGEVRSLAQRSAAAAKEIKELIGNSVDKVSEGYRQVENAGTTMNEIVGAVKRVTDIMGEISAASLEQSQGIEQVNGAIAQMDEMTQQNAALVEEAAAAAESLQDQAASLSQAVAAFKLASGGGSLVAPASVPRLTTRPMAGARPAQVTHQHKPAALPKPAGAEGDVDFDAIIDAHQAWKQKLRNAIQGGQERNLNADEVCKDNACALGKWIYGAGQTFAELSEFQSLRSSHADFHICAGDILRKIQAGEKDDANALLVGDFFELSNRTVQHIVAMKRQRKQR